MNIKYADGVVHLSYHDTVIAWCGQGGSTIGAEWTGDAVTCGQCLAVADHASSNGGQP